MAEQDWTDEVTGIEGDVGTGDAAPGRLADQVLRLVVLRGNETHSHRLMMDSAVSLGRGRDVDIQIQDGSISRRHAIIRLGRSLTIEDLGSANGTRLRGRSLPANSPVEFMPGDLIDIGACVVIVQPEASVSRPRRIWNHDYFESRIEEECARAERTGSPFAVVRLHIGGAAPRSALERVLTSVLRTEDSLALYGPNEYELLLLDSSDADTRTVITRLKVALQHISATCKSGTARFPQDGRNPEALIAHACADVAGITPAAFTASQNLVIEDAAMRRLYEIIDRIADSDIGVLVTGETGVGKEVLAEAVHTRSARAQRPFVRINCAAVAESLFESELFGHEKGAFTGALKSKPGLLETGDGGTVFLDEIGELSMPMQAKLLRALDSKETMRVGGIKSRSIDVRFVAATNRDLEARVKNGAFREDLLFRLNGITLAIPPLRERVTEIARIAREFIQAACEQSKRTNVPRIEPQALELLQRYRWPGNIRELRNVIERAVLLCGDGPIRVAHLPAEKMSLSLTERAPKLPPAIATVAPPPPLADLELDGAVTPPPGTTVPPRITSNRAAILAALEQCGGNQTKAAKLLGISRRTLVTRVKEYRGQQRPRRTD